MVGNNQRLLKRKYNNIWISRKNLLYLVKNLKYNYYLVILLILVLTI